jgi:hypothetical protein
LDFAVVLSTFKAVAAVGGVVNVTTNASTATVVIIGRNTLAAVLFLIFVSNSLI